MSTVDLSGLENVSIKNSKTERVSSSSGAVTYAYSVRFWAGAVTLGTELFSWFSSVPLGKCRGISYTFN
jgi:hypothetical protein